MIKASGPSRLRSIALAEIYVSFLPQNHQITGKFVLGVGEGEHRLGPLPKSAGWSEETRRCLDALVSSMELDMHGELFETSSLPEGPRVIDPKQL